MEEINSNFYFLFNVFLGIEYFKGKCNGYLLLFINLNIMIKYYYIFFNYICDFGVCEIVFIGLLWILFV